MSGLEELSKLYSVSSALILHPNVFTPQSRYNPTKAVVFGGVAHYQDVPRNWNPTRHAIRSPICKNWYIAHFSGNEKLLSQYHLLPHLVFLFFVMGSIGSSGAEVVTVDVRTAKGLIHIGHVYLDVRTVEEFEKGHPDADNIINIPYMFNTPEGRVKNPEFLQKVASTCNKEDHLLVGCQSGVRSVNASRDLLGDGYKNVRNVGGGYLDWIQNQLPVKSSVI